MTRDECSSSVAELQAQVRALEGQLATLRAQQSDAGPLAATPPGTDDRELARAALRAQRVADERVIACLENLIDCFVLMSAIRDDSGRITDFQFDYANPAACRNNCLSAEEHAQTTLLKLLPSHRTTGLFDAYCRVVETGTPVRFDAVPYEDKYAGRQQARLFEIRAWKVGDGFAAAWRDVTEQERKVARVSQVQERLALAQHATAAGVYDYDAATGQLHWDATMRALWGVPADQPVTMETFLAGVHADDRPALEANIQRALDPAGDGEHRAEYRVINQHDGRTRWVQATGRTTFESGRPVRALGTVQNITERKAAELALRASEERFRAIFQHAGFGIAIGDRDGRVAMCNPAFAAMLGYAAHELQGRSFAELVHPDDRAANLREFDRMMQGACRSFELENRYVHRDGQSVWVHKFGSLIGDGDSAVPFALTSDITHRKRASAELRASEARIRRLADAMPQLVWTADADGRVTYYNARAERYAGIAADGAGAFDWHALLHPEDLQSTQEQWESARRSRTAYACEHRLRMRDGTHRWHLSRAVWSPDAQGATPGLWFGTATDIHDLKIAEEQLRVGEQRLRLAAEAAGFGSYDFDVRRSVSVWSPELRAITQFPGDEPVGLAQLQALVHPDDRAHFREMLQASLDPAGAGRHEVDFRIRRADGTVRWVRDTGRTYFSGDGATRAAVRVVGTVQDITERKQLEQQRDQLLESERSARTAVEHLNREKDDFLAVVNHELRSPLATVLGWSRLLHDGRLTGDDAREALDAVLRGSEQLKELIDDLLDVSRAASGKLKLRRAPVDLIAIAQETVIEFGPRAADSQIRLDQALPAQPGWVRGDAARLRQVIANLLSNALKFTPAGGRVSVHVRADGEHVALRVADTGVGIAPDVLPRLFERFQQADSSMARVHKGLGLGLAIVKQIVEMHGGQLTAASDGAGCGATFEVRLPLLADPDTCDDDVGSAACDGLRVLVVDDDAQSLALATRLLTEAGATVVACDAAETALEHVSKAPYDILLSDISMPSIDGYALLRRVRKQALPANTHIPAIAITAFGRAQDEARSLAAGYDVHLTKPLDPVELCATVARLAAER